jgi:riboflavin kinase/FMN adenylyltransferase
MRIIRNLSELNRSSIVAVAMGNFDGVHVGHQAILNEAMSQARRRGGAAYAVTFDPLPAKVLAPERAPRLIMDPEDKFELLRSSGLAGVIVINFTLELSRLTPRQFATDYVRQAMGAEVVVVGYSMSFGHDRAGNAAVMQALGVELGFEVDVVGPVKLGDIEVSSSSVREAIATGNLPLATRMLSRPHFLHGPVVHGRERGRTIGFPTANIQPRTECLPPDGVYATRVVLSDGIYPSITNIGMRPTFAEPERTFEAHIFDFNQSIYDRDVKLELIERIRPERKFDSADELAAQISRDLKRAREILA